jgi:hypothetical protein
LGPFKKFWNIRGNIREYMFITGVKDVDKKSETILRNEVFHILFIGWWSAYHTCRLIFSKFYIFRSRQAADNGKTVKSPMSTTSEINYCWLLFLQGKNKLPVSLESMEIRDKA